MPFRYLFRNWLHATVKQQVTEAAKREIFGDERRAQDAGHSGPSDLGVVFALGIESGGLEDRLREATTLHTGRFVVREGVLHGRNIAMVLSGAGRDNAAAATEALLEGHRPAWVLSAGFAGGLTADMKRNDVLMADHVADAAGGRLAIDLRVDPDSLAKTPHVHVGRLLTVDRVVRLGEEKRSLGQEHGALAVDMETFAVAEVCRRRGARFLAVRVIVDTVDDDLPPDVRHLLAQKTIASKLGAAVGAVWRRPGSFRLMYQLRENALIASERLADFVEAMVEQM